LISLDDRDANAMFCLVLDATVCPINRPSNNRVQRTYYSGKHKQHCIKYEIGVHPDTGRLVWVSGGVEGSVHDMRLMYLGQLLQGILPNELILADKGYIGNWQIITPFRRPYTSPVEEVLSRALSSRRIIVEHVLQRFKTFYCLNTKWRHCKELHCFVFCIIAEIINIDMQFCPMRQ